MRTVLIFCVAIYFICAPSISAAPVGDDFTIGVYYVMPWVEPVDNFSWDYAFMDMARMGCNIAVVSGNVWTDNWAAFKHWDIKVITSYQILNGYPGEGNWDPEDFVAGAIADRDTFNGLYSNGEYVGDTIIGHMMVDEPEPANRLITEDKKDYLRAYADAYHQYLQPRQVYVNHSDPPWFDLNEGRASCSASSISVNSSRITERITAANNIGLDNFIMVAQTKGLADWMNNDCANINYVGLGPCTQEVKDWLASRTNYQDVYEELLTAYNFGTLGCTFYQYNQHMVDHSIVDIDGNDQNGRRAGIADAARDLRLSQGWPGVELFNNGVAFNDRGNYPAGSFTLTATTKSPSGTIGKVIFGKTTDGGITWTDIEDSNAPYSAIFSVSSGKTVIFRAQALDTTGKKSIYAANMINTN